MMLNVSHVRDNMFIPQPINKKPDTFKNVQHFLTQSECIQIKEISKDIEKWEGKVHDNSNESTKVNSVREVDVYPIPMNDKYMFLYQIIFETVKDCNTDYFNFDIAGIFDNLQLLHYKKGHHYDWHTDIGDGIYSNRKISASILLSDNCSGGEIVLKQGADRTIHMEVGDMLLFPSYVLHKVTPVTKGDRWALVTWIQDTKPFK